MGDTTITSESEDWFNLSFEPILKVSNSGESFNNEGFTPDDEKLRTGSAEPEVDINNTCSTPDGATAGSMSEDDVTESTVKITLNNHVTGEEGEHVTPWFLRCPQDDLTLAEVKDAVSLAGEERNRNRYYVSALVQLLQNNFLPLLKRQPDVVTDLERHDVLLTFAEVLRLIGTCDEGSHVYTQEGGIGQVVVEYLLLWDSVTRVRLDDVLTHPGTVSVFSRAAGAVLRGMDRACVQEILSENRDCPALGLCPILAHLGRITDLRTLLTEQSITGCKKFLPYAIYSYSVLNNALGKEGRRKAFKKNREVARSCKDDILKLVTDFIDDAHDTCDVDDDVDGLLFDVHDGCMTWGALELGCMASCSDIVNRLACREALGRRWWGDLPRYSWWTLPLLPFFLIPKRFTKKESVAASFAFHAVGFAIFLALYCHMVLRGSDWRMDGNEGVILMYMILYLIEEIRQIYSEYHNNSGLKLCDKIKLYLNDFWNMLDLITLCVYFIAFLLRLPAINWYHTRHISSRIEGATWYTSTNVTHLAWLNNRSVSDSLVTAFNCKLASHMLLSLNCIVLCIRCLQYFSIHHRIGTLIIVFRRMLIDLFYFMVIVVFIFIGYGVALFSILGIIPIKLDDLPLLSIPVAQIFGELRLEEMMFVPGEYDRCAPDPPLTPRHVLALVLAGFYLLLTNIILVNLLIAMFNSSYQRVLESSEYHNLEHKFRVMAEYKRKGPYPVPVVALTYPVLVYKWVKVMKKNFDACRRQRSGNEKPQSDLSTDKV